MDFVILQEIFGHEVQVTRARVRACAGVCVKIDKRIIKLKVLTRET